MTLFVKRILHARPDESKYIKVWKWQVTEYELTPTYKTESLPDFHHIRSNAQAKVSYSFLRIISSHLFFFVYVTWYFCQSITYSYMSFLVPVFDFDFLPWPRRCWLSSSPMCSFQCLLWQVREITARVLRLVNLPANLSQDDQQKQLKPQTTIIIFADELSNLLPPRPGSSHELSAHRRSGPEPGAHKGVLRTELSEDSRNTVLWRHAQTTVIKQACRCWDVQ